MASSVLLNLIVKFFLLQKLFFTTRKEFFKPKKCFFHKKFFFNQKENVFFYIIANYEAVSTNGRISCGNDAAFLTIKQSSSFSNL